MSDEAVKVVVRCRPMSNKEQADARRSVVDVNVGLSQVAIRNPDPNALGAGETKNFTFDAVYDDESTQRAIYEETAYPLVESVLTGYNGTIFAYGQTGCGKTHTMQGRPEPVEQRGIIPNSFDHIFDHIKVASANKQTEFLVRCSYLEIYNEEIRDLLSNDHTAKLELHENPDQGVYVKDLTQVVVDSAKAIDKVMTDGNRHRTTGATLMNETSSRSHSIFTIIIEQSSTGEDGKDHIVRGKLNLVDLAGSERPSKTGATGARMKEGIKINLSLTALGNVISALVDLATTGKAKHIPYRDSKLTRLLQDSLGGNTKTVMVAAVGPADYNYDETLSTLRYANRAKNIKNKPSINEDPKDALLRQYKDEIERLRQLLVEHLTAAGLDPASLNAILASAGGSIAQQMKALPAAGSRMGAPVGAPSPVVLTSAVPAAAAPAPAPAAAGSGASAAAAAKRSAAAASFKDGATSPMVDATAEFTPTVSVGAEAASSSRPGSVASKGAAAALSPPAAARGNDTDDDDRASVASTRSGSVIDPIAARVAAAAAAIGEDIDADVPGGTATPTPRGDKDKDRDVTDGASKVLSRTTSKMSVGSVGGPSGGSAAANVDTTLASKHLSDAIASALPKANALTAEATEAIEAARREADKERKEREELARKLLALQQMVVGSGRGAAAGGSASGTTSPQGPRSLPTSPARNTGGSSNINGSTPARRVLPTIECSPLSPGYEDSEDPELALAIAREESRREHALARQANKRAQMAAQGAGALDNTFADDGDAALFGDAPPRLGTATGGGRGPGADGTPDDTPTAAAAAGGAGDGSLSKAEKERLVRKVRAKYSGKISALQAQLVDQADEWSQQREAMASTIREQAKEAKLLEALVAVFLSPSEMAKVWERAVWNEESEEWSLPRLKPKQGFKARDKVAAHARQPLAGAAPGSYSASALSMGSSSLTSSMRSAAMASPASGASGGLDDDPRGGMGYRTGGDPLGGNEDGADEDGGAMVDVDDGDTDGGNTVGTYSTGGGGMGQGSVSSVGSTLPGLGGNSSNGTTMPKIRGAGSSTSLPPSGRASQPGRSQGRSGDSGSLPVIAPGAGGHRGPGSSTSSGGLLQWAGSGGGGGLGLDDGGLPSLARKPSSGMGSFGGSARSSNDGPSMGSGGSGGGSVVVLPALAGLNLGGSGNSGGGALGGSLGGLSLPGLNLNLPGNIQLPGLRGALGGLGGSVGGGGAGGTAVTFPSLISSGGTSSTVVLPDLMVKHVPGTGADVALGPGPELLAGIADRTPSRSGRRPGRGNGSMGTSGSGAGGSGGGNTRMSSQQQQYQGTTSSSPAADDGTSGTGTMGRADVFGHRMGQATQYPHPQRSLSVGRLMPMNRSLSVGAASVASAEDRPTPGSGSTARGSGSYGQRPSPHASPSSSNSDGAAAARASRLHSSPNGPAGPSDSSGTDGGGLRFRRVEHEQGQRQEAGHKMDGLAAEPQTADVGHTAVAASSAAPEATAVVTNLSGRFDAADVDVATPAVAGSQAAQDACTRIADGHGAPAPQAHQPHHDLLPVLSSEEAALAAFEAAMFGDLGMYVEDDGMVMPEAQVECHSLGNGQEQAGKPVQQLATGREQGSTPVPTTAPAVQHAVSAACEDEQPAQAAVAFGAPALPVAGEVPQTSQAPSTGSRPSSSSSAPISPGGTEDWRVAIEAKPQVRWLGDDCRLREFGRPLI